MLERLPISSIRAFEAAARIGSFRGAATELHLSPSAVSHAIRKLETLLGTSLFDRSARMVRLTPEGETLMGHVGSAFEELRRGIESVSNRGSQLLRLHSSPSFAAQCLSPRLARFVAAQPGIEVRLAASFDPARFSNGDFDADIVYGPPRAEDLVVIPLGEEVVTPVCAAHVAAGIATPADLLGRVLIQSDYKQVRWEHWFAANDLAAPRLHGMTFDRSFLAIAAAVDGLGVALESTRLAERELASGRLVAPLAGRSVDVRYVGHRLVFPRANAQRRVVRLFADWLTGEFGVAAAAAG